MAVIAAAAEVSVPTVSKVLNGRSDVAPDTRRRVESVLGEFGYARNPRRKAQPAHLIDLVFTEFSPWAAEIIRGANDAALAAKCRIAVTAVTSEAGVDHWMRSLTASRTDGVVLVLTDLSEVQRNRLAAIQVPVVLVDPVGQPDPDVLSIGAANWAGGMAATEHLLALGHRRIGTITGTPAVLCSQARLDGYRAALERAGIPVDPQIVANGDFHYESALAAASALLDLPDPPTAIFAASDVTAMGVYEAARQHQLRLPEHLSVVGFDDVPMAQWVSPPLTTLHQPLAEMAALATRTLLAGDSIGFDHRIELATRLVVRSSTQAPFAGRAGGRRRGRP
ncbi:MAG TPA: LacI family DNA-binding transcriptional regulator [Streptosporangiaceae bacterium]|nr:LacI family DNA-binding transcriptional regulator [Streptosporangiaceae bacterium]